MAEAIKQCPTCDELALKLAAKQASGSFGLDELICPVHLAKFFEEQND